MMLLQLGHNMNELTRFNKQIKNLKCNYPCFYRIFVKMRYFVRSNFRFVVEFKNVYIVEIGHTDLVNSL